MKKLRTHPPRFVALDNRAVDDLRLSVLDVGMLAVALRCPDGADFTVASLARKRRPGREALTGAMRNLVSCGYIVKLKMQDARTGTWRTEFSVADMPFTRDDVAGMLAGLSNTRAVRVEPPRLDPRDGARDETPSGGRKAGAAQGTARVTVFRNSVATRANTQDPQVPPSDGFPTVGEPIIGNPSAKDRTLNTQDVKEEDKDSSLFSRGNSYSSTASSGAVSARTEREIPPDSENDLPPVRSRPPAAVSPLPGPAAPGPQGGTARAAVGARVADAWAAAREGRGFAVPVLGRRTIARSACALVVSGTPEEVLVQAVEDMARQPTWLDLERHLGHWSPPSSAHGRARGPKTYCDACEYGWVNGTDGRVRKCGCWT